MSDDNAEMESMDSDEDIFSPRNRRLSGRSSRRPLRPGVRRSTRNRMQTYDNLNTSWILGTQTLKGYPMFQQHASSSDKEVDDPPERPTKNLRERMPLRSRENHPPNNKTNRHIRDHDSIAVRELRDRTDHDERSTDKETKDKREIHDCQEQPPQLEPQQQQPQQQQRRNSNNSSQPDKELKEIKTRSKSEASQNDDNSKELRARKSDSPNRLREGPVTRYSGMLDKPVKLKNQKINNQDGDDDSNVDDDDDNKQEDNKNENSDDDDGEGEGGGGGGFEDMYSRIKRTRRKSQRQIERSSNNKKLTEESDLSESSDIPKRRTKYSLRQKKPIVDRFQSSNEPRPIRVFRSVLTNSMRRRKHRSKSTSSSDSSDSEPQRYDKKKNKKTRQTTIPQGGGGGSCTTDKKADICPLTVDTNIRFNDVGGLESHIDCLKEMVVFPMMYPHVFDRFHITPPKGVLFHGPPGTGKTLIARALANECSQGTKKVSFFMRKGADCLSKWVGESERQLRLLFEQAQQMKPSIIFFDEIDGLAPVRSTKQDQIHASIVSTLLALMDGLSDRGEVIVIGATNRIDAIDPALRRPGRFDRELFFPLPAMKERLEILKIHVNKWITAPSDELLETLAEKTTGYCGSDLRALCTEAVLQGLRRTYPQIYLTTNRLLLDPERVEVKKKDFMEASTILVPSSHRIAPSVSRKLQPFLLPLLGQALDDLVCAVKAIFPQGIKPSLAKIKVAKGIHRPRMLVTGDELSHRQGSRLAQALLYKMEHVPVQTLDVSTLFAESARSPEETCVQVFNEASRNVPSIIYIRSIDQWWPLVPETVKAVFMCRIAALDPCLPILVLATSDVAYNELAPKVKNLFNELRGEVYTMKNPNIQQRLEFFKPIFMIQSLSSPLIKDDKVQPLEELPLAPDPSPKKLTVEEVKKLRDKEEISLRELRIFLREICAKLARNRQFFMFTKPVDTEEVPDYNTIIKQPMDLETMMTKIDMHCYLCARDFLDDIDLICRNALEYNPDRDPADKLIRHRACSLRDNAYALIKAELDSDFEDKCREISKNRNVVVNNNNDNDDEDAGDKMKAENDDDKSMNNKKDSPLPSGSVVMNGKRLPSSRKRKIPAWARGYVKKITKKKKILFDDNVNEIVEKSLSEKSLTSSNSGRIDSDKCQEFDASCDVVNGDATPIIDHSEISDNETINDTSTIKDDQMIVDKIEVANDDKSINENIDTTIIDTKIDNSTDKPLNCSNSVDKIINSEINIKKIDNVNSNTSSRRESCDELMISVDVDTSSNKLSNGNVVSNDNVVIIDEVELDNLWKHAVDVTMNSSVDVLCDIYVQLSRCVAKYEQTFDRKTLPKDLLKELQRFEEEDTSILSEIQSPVA
ncbi:ATPase family AAA domain-containing protein 2-like isoform X2 [Aphidius gifuensis]|uniref:ATPase family AAA domain-containing protein 2-like isoform X2 n=1 Tax=Aphidius gifuensis TaxID=684658 RepID=UPI001CDD16F4|nr:ATPase family AAA domain-containing protein 2-like isoform X2 [Aphidius gifuensis]